MCPKPFEHKYIESLLFRKENNKSENCEGQFITRLSTQSNYSFRLIDNLNSLNEFHMMII